MDGWWWSYLLSAVGVFGLYVAGSGKSWGWFVGLGAQALWITYATVTEQYGFYASAAAYGFVYLRGGIRGRRAEAERRSATATPGA